MQSLLKFVLIGLIVDYGYNNFGKERNESRPKINDSIVVANNVRSDNKNSNIDEIQISADSIPKKNEKELITLSVKILKTIKKMIILVWQVLFIRYLEFDFLHPVT